MALRRKASELRTFEHEGFPRPRLGPRQGGVLLFATAVTASQPATAATPKIAGTRRRSNIGSRSASPGGGALAVGGYGQNNALARSRGRRPCSELYINLITSAVRDQ